MNVRGEVGARARAARGHCREERKRGRGTRLGARRAARAPVRLPLVPALQLLLLGHLLVLLDGQRERRRGAPREGEMVVPTMARDYRADGRAPDARAGGIRRRA